MDWSRDGVGRSKQQERSGMKGVKEVKSVKSSKWKFSPPEMGRKT